MTIKSLYLALLLLLITPAFVFDSCKTPANYGDAAKSSPSVVRVSVKDRMGSGVIITGEGHVLTSKYLIGDNKSPTVQLGNGLQYQASVAATDDARDLAILKLPANPDGYPAAAPCNSAESFRLNSQVLVMGYPDDSKINQIAFTTGTICGLPQINSVSFLQSDARINAGNIGGPVTDSKGEVIGIISNRHTDGKDTCPTLATAISEAKPLLNRLTSRPQALTAVPAENVTSTTDLPGASTENYLAPDFSLPTVDQREFTLSSLRGKKVVLAFFSTICGACLKTMQCLLPVYTAWPKDELEMVFVISGEQLDDVQQWVNHYGIQCTVVLDSQGTVLNQYQLDHYPALYFLTTDGQVKIKKLAPFDDCTQEFDTLLRQY